MSAFQRTAFPARPAPRSDRDAGPNQEEVAAPAQPGPLGQLRKGLTQEPVIDLLGPSTRTTQNRRNGLEMTSSTFRYNDSMVETRFVNGVLVKYSVSVN
jgi:hypothetical protein